MYYHSRKNNNTRVRKQYNIIGLENIERDSGRLIDFKPMFICAITKPSTTLYPKATSAKSTQSPFARCSVQRRAKQEA
jgi:hypothetical protein